MDYLIERIFGHIGWLWRMAPVFGILILVSLLLMRRGWLASARAGWPETRTNLIYMAVNGPVQAALAGLAVEFFRPFVEIGPALSVAALPFWAQALLAVVVRDFAIYWQHRMKHHPWLWPFHAVHHSDTHLTWMTQFRRHPVDGLIAHFSVVLALSLLGFGSAAVAAAVGAVKVWGYVIHMRVPVILRPLTFVLVTPRVHELHHARDPALHGCNYAVLLSIWDRMFGTYRAPAAERPETGADPLTPRDGWPAHMIHPFRHYWEAAAARLPERGRL